MQQKPFNPRLIKSVTGSTASEFDVLVGALNKAWLAEEKARPLFRTDGRRIRALGGGRNSVLRTSREKLLFILFWFKVYPMLIRLTHLTPTDSGFRLKPMMFPSARV